jgi:iron complex outermembrane receptor protein
VKPRSPGIRALVLLAVPGLLHATGASAQTTTLAPVMVHASDTHVTETPSVSVRIDRAQLTAQNVATSADALRFAPNLQVRERYIGDPNAIWSIPTACCFPT